MTAGRPGILHGQRSYLLQDEDGQVIEPHSISAGLDYPGIGPELSWLKDIGRIEIESITDDEALAAFSLCARLEGILPALEPSHALGQVVEAGADAGQGPDHRDESVRPRRQGRAAPSRRSWGSGCERAHRRAVRGAAGGGARGLVTFLTAGDPDHETSLRAAGGPAGGRRRPDRDRHAVHRPDGRRAGDPGREPARAGGRGADDAARWSWCAASGPPTATTPIVLMGYYNPIYAYGNERFLADAKAAGADGLIVVDLPPEEDAELCLPARAHGLDFIRLATPTTDDRRLPAVLENISGFIYYVSVTGITGQKSALAELVAPEVARIKRHTRLPVAVGFGIREPEQAAEIARIADAVVVGSALVDLVAPQPRRATARPRPELVPAVHAKVRGAGRRRSGAPAR